MPIFIAVPTVFLVSVYFAVPYQNDFRIFFKFFLILTLTLQASVTFGQAFSALFNTDSKATHWSNMIHTPVMLLGGFYLNLKGLMEETPQKYVGWISYISPPRWGFQGLMIAQYENIARGTYAAGNENANDPQ